MARGGIGDVTCPECDPSPAESPQGTCTASAPHTPRQVRGGRKSAPHERSLAQEPGACTSAAGSDDHGARARRPSVARQPQLTQPCSWHARLPELPAHLSVLAARRTSSAIAVRHRRASTRTAEAGGSSHGSWCFRTVLGFRAALWLLVVLASNWSRASLTSSEVRCAASQTAACGERQWWSGCTERMSMR